MTTGRRMDELPDEADVGCQEFTGVWLHV
jgi:hypothetical protein